MKLKKIYMNGFKSFANKTEIVANDGITGVIGPNGSGKSNIADAIRWVLGEQSIKALRGSKPQDVIFSGTQFRRGAGFAEVELLFDNTDGDIPIEYDEVSVGRKLYSDGESVYLLNGATTRLKTVQELFMDTGIGKDGYSIIGQGRIDEILSNNSEKRRKVFEEATGIVKYKERKKEAKTNIEVTEDNLVRITDILSEISNNLETLEEQSAKAKEYLKLKDIKKKLDLRIFKEEMASFDIRFEENNSKLKELNVGIEAKKAKQKENQKNIQKVLDTISNIDKKTEASYKNIGESSSEISNMEKEIALSNEKVSSLKDSIRLSDTDILEAKNKIGLKEEEKKSKIEKIERSKKDSLEFKEELKEKEAEKEKLKKVLAKDEKEKEEKRKQIEEVKDKEYEIDGEIYKEKLELEHLKDLKTRKENEKRDKTLDVDRQKLAIEDEKKKFAKENGELLEKVAKLEKDKENLSKKITEIAEGKNNIEKQKQDIAIKTNKLNILKSLEKEKEGFSFAVKNILKAKTNNTEIGKKALGVITDIITVKKEYTNAIQTALGNSMQNIVVENEEDAKDIIEYLKETKSGKATFLPIRRYAGKKKSDNEKEVLKKAKSINIEVVTAKSVIKTEEKYMNVVESILNNNYIVENMDDAIILSRNIPYIRIVTKAGDVINTSGSITGGYTNSSNNILSRKAQIKTLEEELKKQRNDLEVLEKQYTKEYVDVDKIKENLGSIEDKLSESKITLAVANSNIAAKEDVLKQELETKKHIEEDILKITEDIRNIKKSISENEKKKEELNTKKDRIEAEIKKLDENIVNKEDVKKLEELNEDIVDLKISISSFDENEKSIQEIIDIIQKDIDENNEKIQGKNTKTKEVEKEILKLENSIETLKEKLEQKENENEEIKKIQEKIKEEKKEILEEKEKLETEKENIEKEIDKLLPEKAKLEQILYRVELQRENLANNIWDNYEVTYNNLILDLEDEIYEKYELNERDYDNNVVTFNTKKANSILDKTEKEIKNMGEINIGAIKELDVAKERYDFLKEQKDDLEKSKKELQHIITDISSTMEEQFVQRMKLINKNFSGIFEELFGGGRAKIELDNEKDPLNADVIIKVEPPGKKLQNMLLLSGGERALTAIAILFSILNINPSPFCVLDEIEAALDDANVQRYANYLKKYADSSQFIVITHRKGTMESVDTLYGVTMEENGISKLVSLDLGKIK